MSSGKYLLDEVQRFARSDFMRSLGLQLLTVTLVLMIAALLLMSVTLSKLQENRVESEAMQDTLLEITTIESRLMDFDGAWNGYVLSGNKWYLQRITDDRNELHGALNKLRFSLLKDSLQMERYQSISALVERRDALNTYLLDPDHTGKIANIEVVQAARILPDDIRGLLWQVLDRERMKRHVNDTGMIRRAQESFWIAVGIVCLTFFFGAICVGLSLTVRSRYTGFAHPRSN